uniref:PTI1-like tyrosine-protein kinase 2 n=1 Tax=Erigeron canadensis TaxID=72917 RepID=UPI001CB9272A|nr:PTI1-like tyrosine-protein kinase 2 [Erigeron canadensis]
MLSAEEMNKGKIPKRCYTANIKKFDTTEHMFNIENEIENLSSCKHRNIESLLGFCDEGPDIILVFEFFGGVLLYNHLRTLGAWEKRLKICLEIAHGLNYIHNEMEDQKMVIHRAICSRNIYVDENEGVKITGLFQKPWFLPPNQIGNGKVDFKNTYPCFDPYMDPEYAKTGKLKKESDVYSFGAVMFEILCGRSAVGLTNINRGQGHELLSQVVRRWFETGIIKKKIASVLMAENGEHKFSLNKGPNKDSLEAFFEIAYRCVAETQNERPTMKVVVKELEKSLSFQENNKDIFRMSLEEIKLATHDFSPLNNIGEGGFGRVYKGKVAHKHVYGNYTIVAKRLDTSHGQGEQQYYNELQILYEFKHENVIGLVGYSDETNEKIIVYQHACKGSLDKYLNHASLTWRNRLMICIDFATGLDFLHGGVHGKEVVIHRDIKAANILLFEDWKAKIGDFGLSIISTVNKEADYVIDHACGTPGYCDPLYKKSGFLTIESDIYSFGVVLFEILCGRSTFEIRKYEGQYLPDFVKHKFEEGKQNEVLFEALKKEIMQKSLTTFQNIAIQCLDGNREKRPRAKQILTELKKALEFQEDGA